MPSSRPLNSALAWSAANQVINKLISLVSTMIVFRILSSHDVGVYAAALVLVALVNMINDFGLVAAITQYGGPDLDRAIRTGSTLVLTFSAVLLAFEFMMADVMANLFNEPEVRTVLRILALTTIVDALSSTSLAILIREIRQKRIAFIESAATVVQLVVTVYLAKHGYGPKALAIGMVVSNVASAVMITAPYVVRTRPGFHLQSAKDLLVFGRHLAGANIVTHIALNIDTIMIGRFLNTRSLGRYQAAFNAGSLPSTTITALLQRVAFSSMSRVKDNAQRFKTMSNAYISITVAAALLSGAMLSSLAEPYMTSVYGDKWKVSAPILTILAFLGTYRVVQTIFFDIFSAKGKPSYELLVSTIWLFSLAISMFVATQISVIAVAWAHVLVAFCILAPVVCYLALRLGLDRKHMVNVALLYVPAAACSYIVALLINIFVSNNFVALIVGGLAGSAIFFAITFKHLIRSFKDLDLAHLGEDDRADFWEDDMDASKDRIGIYDKSTATS